MTSQRKTAPSTKHKNLRTDITSTSSYAHTKPTKEKSSQRVEKIEKPRRTTPRLQERFINTLSSLNSPQEPSNEHNYQAGSIQRKRGPDWEQKSSPPLENFEYTRLAKRARTRVSAVSDKSQPLTAKNLKRHTLHVGYLDKLELISSEANYNLKSGGSERSGSAIGVGNASTDTGDEMTASQIT